MKPRPEETPEEYLERLAKAAETLTEDQILAVQWVFGGEGWTAEGVAQFLRSYKNRGSRPLPEA